MELTAQNVSEVFAYCLWREEEALPDNLEISEGVALKASFNPERLKEKEKTIFSMLKKLSADFMQSGGGGMSFLNMCLDKNQNHWGEHRNVDELFILGNAIGKAKFLAPREAWDSMFIGGMPYVLILDK